MIVLIDNYDSFTYNLVQYFRELGCQVTVFRNDAVDIATINALHPSQIVISPGPGNPSDAGISKQVIQTMGERIPILGVCLGHQCIGEAYGGVVKPAEQLMHGKVSDVYHSGQGIFRNIPSPFRATRYHSLLVAEPLPKDLMTIAFTEDGEIMGLQHRFLPITGVQFHPEAFLTQYGKQILGNFLEAT